MEQTKEVVIGLDLGTTNCKALALTAGREVLAVASSAHSIQVPHPGWAQQDAEDVWSGAAACLGAIQKQIPTAKVQAISLSGAMHSLLPVDAEGKPLAPAMTWADQRAAGLVKDLRARTDAHALYERTGCPLQALYHPAKLRWWLDQAPEITQAAAGFVALKDLVLFRLAGKWATDYGLSSATGLIDTRKLVWDGEALALAGISTDKLCPLVSPKSAAGELTPQAAQITGLPAGLPVIAGSSDGGLANLGAGAARPGQTVITVGTSGAIRHLVSQPKLDSQERTWCYLLWEESWFAGGAINNGGLALQWVREHFYPDLAGEAGYQQLIHDAGEVPPGAGGVFLLPYFTGERNPHWNPAARALLAGLSLEHQRGHIARAAMEGVAFCLADVWEALDVSGQIQEPARLTGGITLAPGWAQIISDVLDLELQLIEAGDASVLGAALLGWEALGVQANVMPSSSPQNALILRPDSERHILYQERHKLFQQLYRQVFSSKDSP